MDYGGEDRAPPHHAGMPQVVRHCFRTHFTRIRWGGCLSRKNARPRGIPFPLVLRTALQYRSTFQVTTIRGPSSPPPPPPSGKTNKGLPMVPGSNLDSLFLPWGGDGGSAARESRSPRAYRSGEPGEFVMGKKQRNHTSYITIEVYTSYQIHSTHHRIIE